MIHDIYAVFWKEWRELLNQGGRSKLGRASLLIGVVPGVFFPLQAGRFWVETPVALTALALLPTIVVTAVIDSIVGERERHTLETLLASRLPDRAILYGKLAAAVAFGWVELLGFTLPGLLLVNLIFLRGDPRIYPLPVWIGVLLLAPVIGVLTGSVGAIVSMRARSVRQAHLLLTILSLILWPMLLLGAGAVLAVAAISFSDADTPREAYDAVSGSLVSLLLLAITLLLAIVAILVLAFAESRFRRTKLALE